MNMIFKRKLPVPQEVKEMYPLDEKLALIKKQNDEEIRKIITSLKEKISGKTTKIFNKEKETRGHFIKNPL